MAEDELSRAERIIQELGATIAAPADILPTRTDKDLGYPHIEFSNGIYHFVVRERGAELQRRSTADLDNLLFWVFDSVTFSMASHYEVAHRVPNEDSRRGLFKQHLKLLSLLNPSWAKDREIEIAKILKKHPFRDSKKIETEREI